MDQPPVERALMLLAATQPDKPVEEWARLSIGKRDGRLLQVQDELFGSGLEAVAACPTCGEQFELAFGTQDIRVSAPMLPAQQEVLRVEAGGYEVISDLPTSADLLKVVESSSTDGRESLLQSCIQEARFRGDVIDAATLPDEVVK